MPELHRVTPDATGENRVYAALSDAELTERIRAGAPPAHPAVQELRRRHLPAVISYARLCGRHQVAGTQLAIQAFSLAAEEAVRGIEPRGNWRHHVLTLVQRVGRTWAFGDRRDRLEPEFVAWLGDAADRPAPGQEDSGAHLFEVSSAMLAGFYRLPALTRGVLWYAVIDDEPDVTVATFLKIDPADVPELRDKAQDAMRQAYVREYLEGCGDRRCLGFRRIIEAASSPGDRRRSEDLTLHLAECPSCTRLVAELTRMTNAPRAVIAEGLLGWGGAAYAARGPACGSLDRVPAQPERPTRTAGLSGFAAPARRTTGGGTRTQGATRLFRPVLLVAAVVAVAVVAGTLLATASEDNATAAVRDRAEEPPLQLTWPPVALPDPSVSATGRAPSREPSRSPSPTASVPVSKPPAPAPSRSAPRRPVPIVPGGGYTRVVNADSGLCLDIADGVMEDRTDVVTNPCDGARTQQWSLDAIGLLHSKEDPDYCLDSRGDTDRGVGIWSCDAVNGWNGRNLLFAVDGSGVVRPLIAPGFALEPYGGSAGSPVGFDHADGSGDQRWTGGTA